MKYKEQVEREKEINFGGHFYSTITKRLWIP